MSEINYNLKTVLDKILNSPIPNTDDAIDQIQGFISEWSAASEGLWTINYSSGESSSLIKTDRSYKVSCSCGDYRKKGVCYHVVAHAFLLNDYEIVPHLIADHDNTCGQFTFPQLKFLSDPAIDPKAKTSRILQLPRTLIFLYPPDDSGAVDVLTIRVSVIYSTESKFLLQCNCDYNHKPSCPYMQHAIVDVFANKKAGFFEKFILITDQTKLLVSNKFGVELTKANFKDFKFTITPSGVQVVSKISGLVNPAWINSILTDGFHLRAEKEKFKLINSVSWTYLLRINAGDGGTIYEVSVAETEQDRYVGPWRHKQAVPIDKVTSDTLSRFNTLTRGEISIQEKYEWLQLIWNLLHMRKNIFLLLESRITKAALLPRTLNTEKVDFSLYFSEQGAYVKIKLEVLTESTSTKKYIIYDHLIIDTGTTLILPQTEGDVRFLEKFTEEGELLISKDTFLADGYEILSSFIGVYSIYTTPDFPYLFREGNLEFEVTIKENKTNEVVFTPVVKLNGIALTNTKQICLVTRLNEDQNQIETINQEQIKEFNDNLSMLVNELPNRVFNNLLIVKKEDALADLWLGEAVQRLRAYGYQVNGIAKFESIKFNDSLPNVSEDLFEDIDWFSSKLNLSFGANAVSIQVLIDAIERGLRTVKLGDGTLGIITDDLIEHIQNLRSQTTLDANGVFRAPKSNLVLLEELAGRTKNVELLEKIRNRIAAINGARNHPTEVPVPATITATPRNYQLDGFRFLASMEQMALGSLLADEMGLGKTIQSIITIEHLRLKYGSTFGALIICPVSLINNWEEEFKKFCPGISVMRYHGQNRGRHLVALQKENVVITSYNTFRSDPGPLLERQWNVVLLDEAQNIKNPNAKATKAVQELKANWRIGLTGTPVENKALDAYSIFSTLNPGILGSIRGFTQFYETPINKGDSERLSHLSKVIAPLILRRRKEDVLKDLPSKTEIIVPCEMGQEQREYYEAYRLSIVRKFLDMKAAGNSKITFEHLKGIQALRQVCNHPTLAPSKGVSEEIPSIKLDILREQLNEIIPAHKVLIFSSFVEYLKIVARQLTQDGISHLLYTGSQTMKQRKATLAEFKDPAKNVNALLISLKSGGVGLNLTEADYVFILDPWWNPAAEAQAIDRAHRIGQQNPVTAYKYICKDTLEEKILQLQKRKKSIFDGLINESPEELVKNLTVEDVDYILSM